MKSVILNLTVMGNPQKEPNKGSAYTNPEVITSLKVTKQGVLYTSALCNIHGLWSSEKDLKLG